MLHHLIFITAWCQNVLLRHERKRWTLMRLANSTIFSITHDPEQFSRYWCVVLVRRHTVLKWIWIMLNMWQIFNYFVVSVIFWVDACVPEYDFIVVIIQKYDFCNLQGSVATVLRWGGLSCSVLRHVSFWCCLPKFIKIGQCLSELFKQ